MLKRGETRRHLKGRGFRDGGFDAAIKFYNFANKFWHFFWLILVVAN